MVEKLSQTFGEERIGLGLTPGGRNVIEVFVSEETRTWSVVMTQTTGMSCLMASGESWIKVTPEPQGPEM